MTCSDPKSGRYVYVYLRSRKRASLSICEVKAYGGKTPAVEACTETDKNCIECAEENNKACGKCRDGFFFNSNTQKCKECLQPHCTECNEEGCIQCTIGHFLDDNRQCQELCTNRDLDCVDCLDTDPTQCKACRNGFFIRKDNGQCDNCQVKNCDICDGDGTCKECDEGFFIEEAGKKCSAKCTTRDKNCGDCEQKNQDVCMECVDKRFYLNANKNCISKYNVHYQCHK